MVIAVFGAKGRVGSKVCEIAKKRGHEVIEFDKANWAHHDAVEPRGWLNGDAFGPNLPKIDVVIDFSVAGATQEVADFCKAHHAPLVTGTTGRNAEEKACLQELQQHVAVCEKANFSKGYEQMEKICRALAKLNWDCDLVETHRKGKADRPSGTAKELYQTLLLGGTRTVCVHSLRNGSNFGRHEIVFGTQGESITIIHQAESVDIFARGALEYAEKIVANTQHDK